MTHEFFAYQLIILLLAGVLIFRKFIQILQKKAEIRELLITVIIWAIFAILALFPNLSQLIASFFGFELGINFLLVLSTLITFYILIGLLVKIDKTESTITKLVRELALKEIEGVESKDKR